MNMIEELIENDSNRYNERLKTVSKGYDIEFIDYSQDIENKEFQQSLIENLEDWRIKFEIVNLPHKEKVNRLMLIDVSNDLKAAKENQQDVADDFSKVIETNPKYKNKTQRELVLREVLSASHIYKVYKKQIEVLEKTLYILKTQADYYFNICSSLKKVLGRTEYKIKGELNDK